MQELRNLQSRFRRGRAAAGPAAGNRRRPGPFGACLLLSLAVGAGGAPAETRAQTAPCPLVVEGDRSDPVVLDRDACLTVPAGGTVATEGPERHAVQAPEGHVRVDVRGRLATTGDLAHGFEGLATEEAFSEGDPVPGGTHVTLGSGATVETSGKNAYGIWVKGSGNSVTLDDATVTTTGNGARGIWLWGNDNSLDLAGATVATHGEFNELYGGRFYPHAIDVVGHVNRVTVTDSTITTRGENTRALHVRGLHLRDVAQGGHGNEVSVVGSTLATEGAGGHAIYARDGVNGMTIENATARVGDGAPLPIDPGAFVIRGNDIHVLDSRITTGGDGAHAVYARDNDRNSAIIDHELISYGNMVTVSDSRITTRGAESHGVFAQNDDEAVSLVNNSTVIHGNTITVTGNRIETHGAMSHGVFAQNDDEGVSLVNNSTVVHGNTITVTGNRIETHGAMSHGVSGRTSITGSTFENSAIDVRGDRFVVRDSDIVTRGADAHGLHTAVSGSEITLDDARIETRGEGAHGVFVEGADIEVTVRSGRIRADHGAAIRLTGARNTLAIEAGTVLQGSIEATGGTDLRVDAGASHSTLWRLAGPVGDLRLESTGAIPLFQDPAPDAASRRMAVFDPTALAAGIDTLADMTGLIGETAGLRPAGEGSGARASGGDAGAEDRSGSRLWVSPVYSRASYHDDDVALLETSHTHRGVVVGYAAPGAGRFEGAGFGVAAGYVSHGVTADGAAMRSWDNDGEGWLVDVHGSGRVGPLTVDGGLSAGMVGHLDTRFVNDNAAAGVVRQRAEYDSAWIAPRVSVGLPAAEVDGGWSLTPSLRLRYAAQWIERYRETGSTGDENAEVAARDLGVVEAGARITATRRTTGDRSLSLHAGASARRSVGDGSTRVTLLGQEESVPLLAPSRRVAEVGVRYRMPFAETGELVVGAAIASTSGSGIARRIMGALSLRF